VVGDLPLLLLVQEVQKILEVVGAVVAIQQLHKVVEEDLVQVVQESSLSLILHNK
jgi:hypothetical protein